MVLPVIALIVAMISLFFAIKERRIIKRTIESDKDFMEWRKEQRKVRKGWKK